MKNTILYVILFTAAPLFTMDDEIQLDDKAVSKIKECTKKCHRNTSIFELYETNQNDIYPTNQSVFEKCADICMTLYKCEAQKKLQKEFTREFIARIKSLQQDKT